MTHSNIQINFQGLLTIEPGAAVWEARMLPLCYAAPKEALVCEIDRKNCARIFYSKLFIKNKVLGFSFLISLILCNFLLQLRFSVYQHKPNNLWNLSFDFHSLSKKSNKAFEIFGQTLPIYQVKQTKWVIRRIIMMLYHQTSRLFNKLVAQTRRPR